MKINENPKINDIKILKKNVSNFTVELEKGDKVKIVDVGDRGYDLMHIDSGNVVTECGWDLFK